MKKNVLLRIYLFSIILILHSCNTVTPQADYQSLVRASTRLGMDIDYADNHALYMEASQWIGVPYRSGGNTKKGTDCSGLAGRLYEKVYQIKLERSSSAQMRACPIRVAKKELQEGDLVFFSSPRSKNKVGHVGVYLKNGRFIHASVSYGVIISSLNEPYYRAHWIAGGRLQNIRNKPLQTAKK